MTLFVTLNDDTGSCIDIDAIKAILGYMQGDDLSSVVIDVDNHQFVSPLTPKELRGRIESILNLSVQ